MRPKMPSRWHIFCVLAFLLAACAQGGGTLTLQETKAALTISLTSPAFVEGGTIPVKHTCDGEDLSPPFQWRNVPQATKSLALIGDDPDAPGHTFVHWVLYGIPPTAEGLPEGIPAMEVLPDGARQGMNDFQRIGYGGPCPPAGKPHRYVFKLYALDVELALAPGATAQDLMRAMEGHILAEGRLIGTYQRR
ncbi:MAG: YbhB/YbcL family Raf kinase inhibitor-like protein [Anaerolineae bacterium]|nr:YbhB/YbcL family Raf kinase inhibitor-like protein [Anaerolineae bacterium]MDW8098501.1 YbhB/YbcL family Raf kinase inhibitor-like protein [Anaerolineae bacterium]